MANDLRFRWHGSASGSFGPAPGLFLLAVLGGILATLGAAPGRAATVAGFPGLRVITPSEVLDEHAETLSDGTLVFRDATGSPVRLITRIDDPEIANRGDGTFHPVDPPVVIDALRALPPAFLQDLAVDIYLLPYPRSGMLSSSADARAIYITPGVRPYADWQIHFLVAHEIGHCVHRRYLPDTDGQGWALWAALRGVADSTVFNAGAAHADRPHEIFAEDFRVLFGGELARYDGSIENPHIPLPGAVPGLAEWYERLTVPTAPEPALVWRAGPNPCRASSELLLIASRAVLPTGDSPHVAAFDVHGRLIRCDTAGGPAGDGIRVRLGAPEGGRIAAGAYWIRIESGREHWVVPVRVVD